MSNIKVFQRLSLLSFWVLLIIALATTGFSFNLTAEINESEAALPLEPGEPQVALAYLGGSDDDSAGEGESDSGGGATEVGDVIRNGGFELVDPEAAPGTAIALEWDRFSNGRAHFGWYDDLWREVVHSGDHAQLMEIKEVYGDFRDRVMAVHQTVDVVPNSDYHLTMYVILRSESQPDFRNRNDFEMSWGVDLSGGANYDNVDDWNIMTLTEQFRLGSTGPDDDNDLLFYEMITGTIRSDDNARLTLFIRGLKRWPLNTEVLFNVDDVSLVGPKPGAAAPVADDPAAESEPAESTESTPAESSTSTESPSSTEGALPQSGGVLNGNIPVGSVVLGGVVLILLGTSATASLLLRRRE